MKNYVYFDQTLLITNIVKFAFISDKQYFIIQNAFFTRIKEIIVICIYSLLLVFYYYNTINALLMDLRSIGRDMCGLYCSATKTSTDLELLDNVASFFC